MCKYIGLVTIHCDISETHTLEVPQTHLQSPFANCHNSSSFILTDSLAAGNSLGYTNLHWCSACNPPTEVRPNPAEGQTKSWICANGVIGCHKTNNGTNQMGFQHHVRCNTRRICPDMSRSKGSKCCNETQPTPLPKMEELAHKFNNATVFSTLGAGSGTGTSSSTLRASLLQRVTPRYCYCSILLQTPAVWG